MKISFKIEKELSSLLFGAASLLSALANRFDQPVFASGTQKNYSFGQVFSGEKVSLPPKKNKNTEPSHFGAKRLSIVIIART